jgi:hypothetical protein
MLWCLKLHYLSMGITYTFPNNRLKCTKVDNEKEHEVFIQSFRRVDLLLSVIMISRQRTLNLLTIFSKLNLIAKSEI